MSELTQNFYHNKNRMEQLRTFCSVYQTGSPTLSGKQINLEQSTVSLRIKNLEGDLGCKLFDRLNKKLVPNQNGKEFYQLCLPALQELDGVFEKFLTKREDKKKNLINIGANHISMVYLVPNLASKYQDSHPQSTINLLSLDKDTGLARVREGTADLYIFPMLETPVEFEFIPLVKHQPILLLKKDHPLAQKKQIDLQEVSKYNLVRIDPHLITLPMFEDIVFNFRLKSQINTENGDWEILKNLVREETGVAIISDICVTERDSDLIAIPLEKYFVPMTYGIVLKKGRILPDHIKDFIDICTTKYK